MLSVNMSKQASDRIDAIANLRHACQYRLPVLIQAELRIFDDPTADIKTIKHADWLASHISTKE
jgi:hypothetical protein